MVKLEAMGRHGMEVKVVVADCMRQVVRAQRCFDPFLGKGRSKAVAVSMAATECERQCWQFFAVDGSRAAIEDHRYIWHPADCSALLHASIHFPRAHGE